MDMDAQNTDERPFRLNLDKVLAEVQKNDQEEWEYEYSTTETETYYLTVELSYPGFKEISEKTSQYSRGGYYKVKPSQRRNDPGITRPEAEDQESASRPNDENEAADDGEAEREEDDDDNEEDAEADNTRVLNKGKGVDRSGLPHPDDDGIATQQNPNSDHLDEIQIMELHSQHPIISYRGRQFEGDWAEVIGTELLLTRHDPAQPLPALRHLPENVDLLAASASKILTKEIILEPKPDPEAKKLEEERAKVKEKYGIKIPMGRDSKNLEKAQQVSFLEGLMAVKKMRGEKDLVTVYARPADGTTEAGMVETVSAPRVRARGRGRGRARRRRRVGIGRGKSLTWNRDGEGRASEGGGGGEDEDDEEGSGGLSMATPLQWGDLMTPTGMLGIDEKAEVSRSGGDGGDHEKGDKGNNDSDRDITMTG